VVDLPLDNPEFPPYEGIEMSSRHSLVAGPRLEVPKEGIVISSRRSLVIVPGLDRCIIDALGLVLFLEDPDIPPYEGIEMSSKYSLVTGPR